MNSSPDAPWRGGRAGGYSRRPLEGEPVKGSSSKSVRGPPPLWGPQGKESGTHTVCVPDFPGGDSGTGRKPYKRRCLPAAFSACIGAMFLLLFS